MGKPLHCALMIKLHRHTHAAPPSCPFVRHFRQWRLEYSLLAATFARKQWQSMHVAAWFCGVCVKRWILDHLTGKGEKSNRKEYLSIFSVLCHRLNFFHRSKSCLCAPIDWQLAPEPLRPLKIPSWGFRFQARPRAPLLSASGRLAPIEPIPVSTIQPAYFVCLHLSRLPATHRALARWGWQGVNADKNMAVRKKDR